MERLLHYTWKHCLFPPAPLTTSDGRLVEVINPGLSNMHSGPDFFNAKVRIDGTLWVGNVEIHQRSSDWKRHGHDGDAAYDSVVLHVCGEIDSEVKTSAGRLLPQLQLQVPQEVMSNYEALLREETYPPCYRMLSSMPSVKIRAWLTRLAFERLEMKADRVAHYQELLGGDREGAFFVTIARAFGFGVNAEAFEAWALSFKQNYAARHRDNNLQIEALFFGQAGLLSDEAVKAERRDEHFMKLQREYAFLCSKFSLTHINHKLWRFLRLRPHNFPTIRLAQLVQLFCENRLSLAALLERHSLEAVKAQLTAGVNAYWAEHFTFGRPSKRSEKLLQRSSIENLIINAVCPTLFFCGKAMMREELCQDALDLLEQISAEDNVVVRKWARVGLRSEQALDSQALLQLSTAYCERHDCLRCNFGHAYLSCGLHVKHELAG